MVVNKIILLLTNIKPALLIKPCRHRNKFVGRVAGHALLKILSTFLFKFFKSDFYIAIIALIPFSIFVGLVGLELAVSIIQAYVFVVLTCSYIKDALESH